MQTPSSVPLRRFTGWLIAVPIGLWLLSLGCDLTVAVADADAAAQAWFDLAWYAMLAGLVGILVAAVPALVESWSTSDGTLHNLATARLVIQLLALVTCVVDLWARIDDPASIVPEIGLSLLGLGLLALAARTGIDAASATRGAAVNATTR